MALGRFFVRARIEGGFIFWAKAGSEEPEPAVLCQDIADTLGTGVDAARSRDQPGFSALPDASVGRHAAPATPRVAPEGRLTSRTAPFFAPEGALTFRAAGLLAAGGPLTSQATALITQEGQIVRHEAAPLVAGTGRF